jgi:molybdopterin molybdotransferase
MAEERNADWLTLQEAWKRVLASIAVLPSETVPLDAALGRVLAEDVTSPVDHPPWDCSAMDGVAVRAADVRGASAESPILLTVVESVAAGGFPTRAVAAGEAIRIMTGAPVPTGADGVVRVEHTRKEAAGSIAIIDDGDAGRNIRQRGEDLHSGDIVLRAGRTLGAADIGILAMVGSTDVRVHRRPRVAILSTGDELAGPGEYELVRSGRRIANSNGPALAAAVREAGGDPVPLGIARDDAADIASRVSAILDVDVLITTAGASVGDHDVVKDALEGVGMKLDFWRVRMKPGSPFSFGRIPRSDGEVLVFCLPGYPVSALVTFRILAAPALRALAGRLDLHDPTLLVRAGERFASTAALTHFQRVYLEQVEGEPLPVARLTGPQGSGILTSLADADALIIVPEGVAVIEQGTVIRAISLARHDQGTTEPPLPTGPAQ